MSDEKKIDNLAERMYDGLEKTVQDLQASLPLVVDELSSKQLRRALKAVISYPEIETENARSMSEKEQKFNAGLIALHQASVHLEIRVLGQLQQEHDRKIAEEAEKGEQNE
jgi:hypothetical protein